MPKTPESNQPSQGEINKTEGEAVKKKELEGMFLDSQMVGTSDKMDKERVFTAGESKLGQIKEVLEKFDQELRVHVVESVTGVRLDIHFPSEVVDQRIQDLSPGMFEKFAEGCMDNPYHPVSSITDPDYFESREKYEKYMEDNYKIIRRTGSITLYREIRSGRLIPTVQRQRYPSG